MGVTETQMLIREIKRKGLPTKKTPNKRANEEGKDNGELRDSEKKQTTHITLPPCLNEECPEFHYVTITLEVAE